MLPTMIPKPMGISNIGSYSFKMARAMKNAPMAIMMMLPNSALEKPV